MVPALSGGEEARGSGPDFGGDAVQLHRLATRPKNAEPFEALFVEDRDHVAVLEVTGSYDKEVDGLFNIEPRRAVGQEFFRHHPDELDFLFVFTTFEFDTGSAIAFHVMARNEVTGIGVELFDRSAELGSDGRLQGLVEMGALGRYATQPLDPGFEDALVTMGHEVMHQWCCYLGAESGALLGRDGSHWSFLLDSDASLLYGSDWRDHGDGTFTATAVERFLSPLDLYLAGFYGAEEVAPWLLIDNPAIDAGGLPIRGITIEGTAATVGIDDVVATDGVRSPDSGAAPRELRSAFVLLKRPEDTVTGAEIAAIDRLRRELAARFAIWTGGRGLMRVMPRGSSDGETGQPTATDGGEVRPPEGSDLAAALAWLRARQSADGFWQDRPGSRLRDTTVALATLVERDPEFVRAADAAGWLAERSEASTDYLARRAVALELLGADTAAERAELLARQGDDGGWGIDGEHRSDPLDTALAVLALAGRPGVPAPALDAAVAYLGAAQGEDGGWSHVPGAASRTGITTTVLKALDSAGGEPAAEAAVAWLAARQNGADGGFGDSPSTVHDTAEVLAILGALGRADAVDRAAAEAYLRSRQSVDGGWDGSVYATAVAVAALDGVRLADLAFAGEVIAEPAAPRDGAPVEVRVTVMNAGTAAAAASFATLYEGDPGDGVVVAEEEVPALQPGQSASLILVWDSTDRPGTRVLTVVLDAGAAVRELDEGDNRAAIEVEVDAAPEGADLAVAAGEIAVSPPAPAVLPAELAISALVRNFGLADAPAAAARLWLGEPGTGTLLGAAAFPVIASRTSVAANFFHVMTTGGSAAFTVEVVSDGVEDDLANNAAAFTVTPTPSLDLAVAAGDLAVVPNPAVLGRPAAFEVTLRNRGTLDAPPAEVAVSLADGTGSQELARRTVTVAAGGEHAETVFWIADRAGELVLSLEIDPEGLVLENDESNNQASLAFTVTELTEPDLALTLEPPAAEVRDGERLELAATVANGGGVASPASRVRLYDGDPEAGGTAVAEAVLPALAVGTSSAATLVWDTLGAAGGHHLVAVADPDGELVEVDEGNNRGAVDLEVLPAPAGVDLEVPTRGLLVSPELPDELPVELAGMLRFRNLGLDSAPHAGWEVWDGEPGAGVLVAGGRLDLAARSDAEVGFTYLLGSPVATLTAVLDPGEEITEADEANNRAERELSTAPSFDLEVTPGDLEFLTPTLVDYRIRFRVTVRNRGTRDLPHDAEVIVRVTDGAGFDYELGRQLVFLEAGQARAFEMAWQADRTGELELAVELDGRGITESDPANNAAALGFTVGSVTDPNLVVRSEGVSFDPDPGLEGRALTLQVVVENDGAEAAEDFETAAYDGYPGNGGTLVAGPVRSTLAAGESRLVTLTWERLAGDAERELFVVVDPGDEIVEVDEGDNLAFRELEVLGLPDLAVSEASLSLAPGFPRPGEAVTATVAVANLGDQEAAGVEVAIYDADPSAGGEPLAPAATLSLAGGATAEAAFAFTVPEGDALTVFAVVDPEGELEERTSANNSAERRFAVQEGDFTVSSRYFSPDGDGVLDNVRFLFRLEPAATVTVSAVDRRGRAVRTFEEQPDVTHSEVEWDGRDDRGRIVRDGPYRLRATGLDGAVLGEAMAVVDNNRTGLLRAAGTDYESFVNLTCQLPEITAPRFTDDERWVYFTVADSQGTATRPGVHRISTGTFTVEEVYGDNTSRPLELAVSEDASWVAWAERDVGTTPFTYRLFLARGDGRDRLEIGTSGTRRFPVGFDRGSRHLFYAEGAEIIRSPIDQPEQREVVFSGIFSALDLFVSPDRRTLFIRERGAPRDRWLLDLETGAVLLLFDSSDDSRTVTDVAWLADGSRLAVAQLQEILIFDRTGALETTLGFPEDYQMPAQMEDEAQYEPTWRFFQEVSWAESGSRLATRINYAVGDGGWLTSDQVAWIEVDTGEVTSVGWTVPRYHCSCTYHVSTWDGERWVERGTIEAEPDFTPKGLDLSSHLPDAAGEYKVRLSQRGFDTAFVDRASLWWGEVRFPPSRAFDPVTGSSVLAEIERLDRGLLDLHGGEIEIHWSDLGPGSLRLSLSANEDGEPEPAGSGAKSVAGRQEVERGGDKEAQDLIQDIDGLVWAPNDDALLLYNAGYRTTSWAVFLGEPGVGDELCEPTCPPEIMSDPDNRWQRIFSDISYFGVYGAEALNSNMAPSGRLLTFNSADQALGSEQTCHGFGDEDVFLMRSFQNLTADLRIRRSVDPTAVLLEGSAVDLNFKSYRLEYTSAEAPEAWRPVAPPRDVPVLDGLFQTWVPPGPGTWLVRLTVEDLAGNRRQAVKQVSSAAFPEIADVYLQPELFSPNSDGVLDETFVHFRALEPVVVEIEILDRDGVRQALLVEEAPVEGEVLVPWDGRGFDGELVADGEYTVRIHGSYEQRLEIDTAAPEVALELADPYRFEGGARLSPTLRYTVSPDGLGDVATEGVERGEGGFPAEWRAFRRIESREADLDFEEFTNGNFRVRVADPAGNVTVETTGLGAEKLMLVELGDHAVASDGSGFEPIGSLGRRDLQGLVVAAEAGGVYDGFTTASGALRFRLAETVRGQLAEVWVEHREAPADGGDPPWNATAIGTFFRPGNSQGLGAPPQGLFEVAWTELEGTGAFERQVRIVAEDLAGTRRSSAAFVVRGEEPEGCDGLFFGGRLRLDDPVFQSDPEDGCVDGPALLADVEALVAGAGIDPEIETVIWGYETVAGDLSDVELLLRSTVDPAYGVWSAAPLVAQRGDVFLFLPAPAPRTCARYSFRLSAETPPELDPETGVSAPRALSVEAATSTACVDLLLAVEAQLPESCGEPSPERLTVTVRPIDETGETPLQDLRLVRRRLDGGEEVLLSVAEPVSDLGYEHQLDLSLYEEGVEELAARVVNTDGQVAAAEIEINVDRVPPAAAITFPEEGTVVCGFDSRLEIEGTVSDAVPSTAAGPFFGRLGDGPPLALPFWGLSGAGGRAPGAWSASAADRLEHSGVLGELNDVSGPVQHTLKVWDRGGNLTCVERSYVVDAWVSPIPVTVDFQDFSPDGDGIQEQIRLSYQADEMLRLDVEVWGAVMTPDGCLVDGPRVRSLAEDLAAFEDGHLFWDGTDEGGAPVADGAYLFAVRNRDACGNQASQGFCVLVDTVPPALEIYYPTLEDQDLPVEVEVDYSTAGDSFFALSFGETHDPTSWQPLAVDSLPSGRKRTRWNTLGLEGDWTLRLEARDRAGNRAEVRQPVTLPVRADLVAYFEPSPELFSPNGDGRRDTVALRFGVLEEADVELAIEDLGGHRLVEVAAERLAAGGAVRPWNGLDAAGRPLPDGRYRAVLVATLASDPNFTQSAAVTFELDATPPAVVVSRPHDGFAAAGDAVEGAVEDLNLIAYTVLLTPDVEPPAWRELGRGEAAVTGALAPLGEIAEGDYRLKVLAEDAGESRSEVVTAFTVDATPPQVTLAAPLAGAILGAVGGAVEVTGSVADEHLASWLLEVGEGASPAAFTTLAGGEEVPPAEPLTAWDLAPLADGIFTLRLSAADRAGNAAEIRRTVEIDNTPPATLLTLPADGAVIAGATPIAGTATDAHFVDYRLEVAAAETPETWIEILHRTEPVTGGPLHDWRVPTPDGSYVLRLTASDVPGNLGRAEIALTVDTAPPAPPTGLAATVEGQGGRLQWTANSEEDLAGYRVWRDGVEITSGLVAEPTFLDPALAEGTYVYQVTALDQAGNESERSASAELEVDFTPPVARIFAPEDGSRVSGLVEIRGSADGEDLAEYRVFAEPLGGTRALLRRSTVPARSDFLSQWSSLGQPEEARFLLTLEAEDLAGNVGVDAVEVVVDNQPPATPQALAATPAGSDVQVTWTGVADADLAGYLLFRDGRVANAPGPVVGDLAPYALSGTSYLDPGLPDGTYSYEVHALDRAGNLSGPSNADDATVETRPPRTVIVDPQPAHRFEAELSILAETEDADVAEVQFQYRPATGGAWIGIGPPDTEAPWTADLDPVAVDLGYGNLQLRAVATDVSNNTDPAPPPILVAYADLTPPAPVTSVATLVDGGDVTVSWDANAEPDLAGYLVYRTSYDPTLLTPEPIAETSFLDPGLEDARSYTYSVTAVDLEGNESPRSPWVPAPVFTPRLTPPYSPTPRPTGTLDGLGRVGYEALAELANASGSRSLPPVAVEPAETVWALLDGAFTFAEIPLELGVNTVTVRLEDAAGNRSKAASATVVAGTVPSPPQGLAAAVSGLDVELFWEANPESDLLGYRLLRDGEPVRDRDVADFDHFAASSGDGSTYAAEKAFDGDPATFWWPYLGAHQWLEAGWPGPRIVTGVEIDWVEISDVVYAGKDFRIEGLHDGSWIPLAEVEGNAGAANEIDFALPYRTDRLRLFVEAPLQVFPRPLRLAEMRIREAPLLPPSPTAVTDTPADGFHVYALTALSELGFESAPSDPTAPLAVGDVTPPEPPVLTATVSGSDVELAWTEVADAVRYDLFRDEGKIAEHGDLESRLHVDPRRPNGTYRYLARAIDEAGNASDPSNEVEVTVAVEPPPAPVDLAVAAPAEGRALDVTWRPGDGPQPLGYVLLRSAVSGGPYEEVAVTSSTAFRDQPLADGAPVFYVVVAFDPAQNRSDPSNEASGVPENTLPPTPPALHYPTVPGRVLVTDRPATTLVGRGEPGGEITLRRDGQDLLAVPASAATVVDSSGFAGAFGLLAASADGRYVWIDDEGAGTLVDFATGGVTTFDFGNGWGYGRWLPDGGRLVYTDAFVDDGESPAEILRLTAADGNFELLATIWDGQVAVPAPAGELYAVLGRRDGAAGIFLFDPAEDLWTFLVAVGNPYRVAPETLAWSPDGARLAWVEDVSGTGDVLYAFHLGSGTLQAIDSDLLEDVLDWSPDGGEIVFSSARDGQERLWAYRFDGTYREVVGREWLYWPQLSPDGRALVYQDWDVTGDLYVRDLASDDDVLIYTSDELGWTHEWTASGHVVVADDGELLRLSPPGRFELDGVALGAGDNVFTAVHAGAESAPIVISRPQGAEPDYALELSVVPRVMAAGGLLRVTATVLSAGAVDAPPTGLSIAVIGPGGFVLDLADGEVVGPLAAGESRAVVRQLAFDAAAGDYTVVAAVDPLGQVAEASEANNLATAELTVAADAGPLVAVALDQPLYQRDEDLAATAEILGVGVSFDGALEIAVEDDAGFLVHAFDLRPVADLTAGELRIEVAEWSVGSTFAGAYRVHARLRDAAGTLVADAFAPFAVHGQADLTATVASDAPSYPREAVVTLTGSFEYLAGNLQLAGVEAVLTVEAAGAEVASWAQLQGTLLPGAGAVVTRQWASGDAATGPYRAIFEVRRGGEVLAADETIFELVIGAPEPVELAGSASLADVHLEWTASPSADVVRYELYRDGEWILTESDLERRTHLDPGLANGTYVYQVLVFNSRENHAASNEVAVTVAVAELAAAKTWTLVLDRDSDGAPGPGDRVRYRILLDNVGTETATALTVTDPVPERVALVEGSAAASRGTVESSDPIVVAIPVLEPGAGAEISFEVELDTVFPAGSTAVVNQGSITAAEAADLLTDDPATPEAGDPTVLEVEMGEISVEDVEVPEGDEGTAEEWITARLAAAVDREIRADYTLLAETATAGADFTAAEGTLVFAPGDTAATVAVAVIGDLYFEGDETFRLELGGAVNAVITDGVGIATIVDDELCTGPELLVNPGAERAPEDGEIQGWTRVESDWPPRLFDPEPAAGDAYFFAGSAEFAELVQDVDVGAWVLPIAAGGQQFAFTGLLRVGDEVPPDAARVVVEYRDAANALVLDAWESEAPASSLEWTPAADVREAPTGTGWIRVRLLSTAFTSGDNDGYFDALSLRSLASPTLAAAEATVYEADGLPAVFDLRLACALEHPVAVDFTTRPGTATPEEDYRETAGSLSFDPGVTEKSVAVPIVVDEVEEPLEDFFLELGPIIGADLVLLGPAATGTIVDSRPCTRSPGYWKNHRQAWPAAWLRLGGVLYDDAALLGLLRSGGNDAADHLARQLVAARLNLLAGTDPFILPVVEAADVFLAEYPPGSDPRGEARDEAEAMKDELDAYNNLHCANDD